MTEGAEVQLPWNAGTGNAAVPVLACRRLAFVLTALGLACIGSTGGCGGDTAVVDVASIPTTVTVTPGKVQMTAIGDTVRLSVEIRDQHGWVIEAPGQVQWTSGDPAVAVVDGGVVRAAGNGETSITATAGSVSGAAAVTVTQVVSTVDVSPDRSLLDVGDTVRLSADVRDANGHAVEDAAVSWTSSDLSVARVDSAGLVTALAKGEAVVAASSDAERDAVSIMVFGRRDEAALAALYMAADGPNWTNSDGWLSEAPLGEWYGVETDAEGRVANLDLNGNRLRGTIVAQLGDLDGLKQMDFGFNQLTGVIPAELGVGSERPDPAVPERKRALRLDSRRTRRSVRSGTFGPGLQPAGGSHSGAARRSGEPDAARPERQRALRPDSHGIRQPDPSRASGLELQPVGGPDSRGGRQSGAARNPFPVQQRTDGFHSVGTRWFECLDACGPVV